MTFKVKTICCIGAGYVGGPTMAIIADRCPELMVLVVDINKQKISDWNNKDLSKLPVYEPGLSEIIERCRNKNLFFTTKIMESIKKSDMVFISVNTPTKEYGLGAGEASDLRYIENSAREIASAAEGHTIVVEKSTIPVKTAEVIKKILASNQKKSTSTFSVLSSPEFLAEGNAIEDLENPSRVLIGGECTDAIEALANIYLKWVKKEKILKTNIWSSELSKLSANAFLAQRVSSINSISALCEKTGANINEVSEAIGMDDRIGAKFLNSGPGFGGSCFKKDILNLIYICKYYGLHEAAIYWENVIKINEWQQKRISDLVVNKLFGTVIDKTIGILGFSFKANTNDTRESPAINICKNLLEEGAFLNIYDPKVEGDKIKNNLKEVIFTSNKKNHLKISIMASVNELVKNCDAIIILTEWDEFKSIDWSNLSKSMRSPSWIFDCRDIIKEDENIPTDNGLNIWKLGCDRK